MVLKNCRLIPELCEGFQEEMADIRVEGTDIAEILPAGGNYPGEEVIDCTGKTVLPGLFNIHVHLAMSGDLSRPRTEYESVVAMHRFMQTLLAYGYTSLRDVGGPHNIAIKFRNAINAGKMVGPDIKASGWILTPDMPIQLSDNAGWYSSTSGKSIASPDDARRLARWQLAQGADYIKILGCDARPYSPRGPRSLFTDAENAALIDVAEKEGTYVAVHTNSVESLSETIDLEVASIEHAFYMKTEHVDQLIAHGRKSNLVLTLHVAYMYHGDKETPMLVGRMRDAYDAGITIGWGTDTGLEAFLDMPEAEFYCRSKFIGIPNVDLLKQATINSAIINRTSEQRGSIKVGKKADFAIFDGKPDEDLHALSKPCAYVLKDGKVVAREGFVFV